MSNSFTGARGEDRAVAFLVGAGYRILGRNLRMPGGEIDVVAMEGQTLVFVEVKRRRGTSHGAALTAVDARKRTRLQGLAADYAQVVAPGSRYRFDIVAIDGNRLTLHRNAF